MLCASNVISGNPGIPDAARPPAVGMRMAAGTRRFGLLCRAALLGIVCQGLGRAPAAPPPPPRVTVLVEDGALIYQQAARGFEEAFGDPGRLEVIRFNSSPKETDERLAGLEKSPPSLIVAIGTQIAGAARGKLPAVPVVYCLALNPAQNHLAGPDIGGVSLEVDLAKELASIQKALPKARRIGVIYDEATSGKLVRQAQKLLSGPVKLVPRAADTPQEAARIIPELLGEVDAFWLLWDRVIANPANFKLLVEYSLRGKVALIAPAAPFVEAGALMSVGADSVRAGQRAAEMAREVLERGKRPGEMVEPAENTVVTINGQVAKRLGIPIPADLRAEILSQ